MDFKNYSDRSRFGEASERPPTRYFVLQGVLEERSVPKSIRASGLTLHGIHWHVVLETPDLDIAWGNRPSPGLVLSREEIQDDPVISPLLDDWLGGKDDAHHSFHTFWMRRMRGEEQGP